MNYYKVVYKLKATDALLRIAYLNKKPEVGNCSWDCNVYISDVELVCNTFKLKG